MHHELHATARMLQHGLSVRNIATHKPKISWVHNETVCTRGFSSVCNHHLRFQQWRSQEVGCEDHAEIADCHFVHVALSSDVAHHHLHAHKQAVKVYEQARPSSVNFQSC